ncbi:ACT domain-containing protein [Caballeronia sp. LZ062]|uniref:ACT domain-containing protein n=1 Tax=unclassified Caballeronia TaxID=2646786 RepID=UPI00286104F2|nr:MULTISPECIES: ACT domain-containing protein [unclassified Caballeronia]MDR5857597.1 ACT domain-containing protein [Caballeronia sp. LZ050]MDR5869147.1 ACT domain-containing protein [Caballeronia sp. LZ062]
MSPPVSDLQTLLASLQPELQPGVYVFASLPDHAAPGGAGIVATFREREGVTVVMEEGAAQAAGVTPLFRAAWITLTVHSDLNAVGLTAAFARALGDAGISCNVMAAACHDHIFVPVEAAGRAMDALLKLQQGR